MHWYVSPMMLARTAKARFGWCLAAEDFTAGSVWSVSWSWRRSRSRTVGKEKLPSALRIRFIGRKR